MLLKPFLVMFQFKLQGFKPVVGPVVRYNLWLCGHSRFTVCARCGVEARGSPIK